MKSTNLSSLLLPLIPGIQSAKEAAQTRNHKELAAIISNYSGALAEAIIGVLEGAKRRDEKARFDYLVESIDRLDPSEVVRLLRNTHHAFAVTPLVDGRQGSNSTGKER